MLTREMHNNLIKFGTVIKNHLTNLDNGQLQTTQLSNIIDTILTD